MHRLALTTFLRLSQWPPLDGSSPKAVYRFYKFPSLFPTLTLTPTFTFLLGYYFLHLNF